MPALRHAALVTALLALGTATTGCPKGAKQPAPAATASVGSPTATAAASDAPPPVPSAEPGASSPTTAPSAPPPKGDLEACTEECVRASQMKAVSIEQIEADCRKGCASRQP